MRTLRAALVCFALGALLLAGKSAASSLLPEPAPTVAVTVPRGATEQELMEAIWVAAEMRAGGAFAHSVIALETMHEHASKSG